MFIFIDASKIPMIGRIPPPDPNRSRSHRSSRRRYSRSRSRSRRRRSRSRSRSSDYRRRRSHSRSPMSNRRRHMGNRVCALKFVVYYYNSFLLFNLAFVKHFSYYILCIFILLGQPRPQCLPGCVWFESLHHREGPEGCFF